MEAFIYYFGAWAFSAALAAAAFAVVHFIEKGGASLMFLILATVLYLPLYIIFSLTKNYRK